MEDDLRSGQVVVLSFPKRQSLTTLKYRLEEVEGVGEVELIFSDEGDPSLSVELVARERNVMVACDPDRVRHYVVVLMCCTGYQTIGTGLTIDRCFETIMEVVK